MVQNVATMTPCCLCRTMFGLQVGWRCHQLAALALSRNLRVDDGNCLLNGGVNGRYIRMMTYIHVLSVTQRSSCFSIFF